MSVGFPVTSSAFSLHKPMNKEQFPYPNEHTNPPIQKEVGIVSLLGSDTSDTTNHHKIKRTLSADMSSPKWLQNNGFSSMKRAQSSDRLNGAIEKEEKKGAFEDIWSSILSSKGSGSGQLPPPYVHPMVKRTTSSLSEKSLEICTESLGSETGSDGFSFMVGSDETDKDSETTEDHQVEHAQETPICGSHIDVVNELGHVGVFKGPVSPTPSLSSSGSGSRLRSSFPPPLPSLANRNGSNVHMRSHRQDGRLVLEAVEVPSKNCFKAQRQDGRLLLTFASDYEDGEEDEHDVSVLNDEDELGDVDCGDEDQEEDDKVVEEGGSCFPMEMINVQQPTTPTLIMSKFKWLNTTRLRNENATITTDRIKVDEHMSLLLPPRPKTPRTIPKDGQVSTTKASSILNAYEYYWRQFTANSALAVTPRKEHTSNSPQPQFHKTQVSKHILDPHQHTNRMFLYTLMKNLTLQTTHQQLAFTIVT